MDNTHLVDIAANVKRILNDIPGNVLLMAAAKSRNPAEVIEAVEAGVKIIGENYVQEAEEVLSVIGRKVKWHFIGHLQKNKVKKAVATFDLIETIDSAALAGEISKRSADAGKTMPVFVEVNSGREGQKFGVPPGEALALIREISRFPNIKVAGIMTMGPFSDDPEDSRPYFRITREIFDEVGAASIDGVAMEYLSMGMSGSYRVAIEEGANIIRIGTGLFGERVHDRL